MAKRKTVQFPAVHKPADETQPIREAYIRFMAPVVPQSAMALLKIIDAKIAEGVQRLHLLLSSPGGSVFHGLSISNFLRGSPLEVHSYNFGSVDSIGVVIFCAGTRRLSVPHARFLIHGVSMNVQGNASFDDKSLEEKIKSLKIDYQNIAKVIADTCSRNPERVMRDMNDRTTLNPQEAITYGLVHEVRSQLFPANADLSVVNEDGTTLTSKPAPVPVIKHVTEPATQAFTTSNVLDHGTYF